MRIGHGYDVHKFAEGRRLVLGGVEIPSEKGLLGHSDADVLTHAVMDAILGAMALGDIGKHFPDNDDTYKDISSMELLKRVYSLMLSQGCSINNIDCTVIALSPKLSPYIEQMRINLANALHTSVSNISIKATTEEGLGLGNDGIGAHCVCIVNSHLSSVFAELDQ